MSCTQDDAIEALLRKQFDGPVSDEGFSQRLMERLPQRRRRATWPLWGGIVAGVIACWMVLLGSPLLRIGWHDWMNDQWSAPAITVLLVMMGMTLLAFAWGVAEAGDR
ncbi:MAG TPA: hypothetical protein VFK31_09215 [Rhodanobacteraceae bacterium]|jgi:hypothetical protein|nr:hypothetical protein [Rhodanobacteraceae bacterium]